MLKRIFTACSIVALVLIALAFLWPQRARVLTGKIITGIDSIETARLPILGYREPALKIVDPAAIAETISEEVPRLTAFFQRTSYSGEDLIKEDIIDATNKARIAEGIPPLRVNEALVASAKLKADDMITLEYFEHESPSGKVVSDLGAEVGYDYIIMGENLALGNFDGADDLVQAWMDSPGHRANILNTLYQEIGIYAAKGMFEGREVWFAVQHFGTQRGTCPAISKSLKRDIDVINADLDRQQIDIEILKKQIEQGTVSGSDYEAKVDQFNRLITVYNETLGISRQKIFQYNAQVSKFNNCLLEYQT